MAINFWLLTSLLMSITLTMVCMYAFKLWKKRNDRRSPLDNRQVGHVPGQQLVERLSDTEVDLFIGVMAMFTAWPLMFIAKALSLLSPVQFVFAVGDWVLILTGTILFIFAFQYTIKHWRIRQNIKDGLLAERVTGMQLNRLWAQNCIVMHDVPCEAFNIDHVVISPRGVYAVETKSFRKPKNSEIGKSHSVKYDGNCLIFPDFSQRAALEQSERQAKWLARFLKESLAKDIAVIPTLALPGWHLDQTESVWKSAKVKVFTPMGDGANFMAKDISRLDSTERALIAKAIAIRYPSISS